MLRPKIFPMLWKTWVAYGLPHGFVRHDKILPIQPPNLKKKTPFQQDRFVFKMPTLPQSAPSEWPQVAAPDTSQRVAASGRPRHFPASGRKWPQVAAPASSKRLAASGRKWRLSAISISTLKATSLENWVQSWQPRTNAVFLFFISSTVPGTKTCSQVIRSVAPVMQNHLSKCEDLIVQNAPLSGNQRPGLLTCLTVVSFVLRLPRDMHRCRSSSNVPRLLSFLKMLQNHNVWVIFD